MKLRTGFVTNSSSYSSAEVHIENPLLIEILQKYKLLYINRHIRRRKDAAGGRVIYESNREATGFCPGPGTLDEILDRIIGMIEATESYTYKRDGYEAYGRQIHEAIVELEMRRREIFDNYEKVYWLAENDSYGEAEPFEGVPVRWDFYYNKASHTEDVRITYMIEGQKPSNGRVETHVGKPEYRGPIGNCLFRHLLGMYSKYRWYLPGNDSADWSDLHIVIPHLYSGLDFFVYYIRKRGGHVHTAPCEGPYIQLLADEKAEPFLRLMKEIENGLPVRYMTHDEVRNLHTLEACAPFGDKLRAIDKLYGRQMGDNIRKLRYAKQHWKQVFPDAVDSEKPPEWIARHIDADKCTGFEGKFFSYLLDKESDESYLYKWCVHALGGIGKPLCRKTDYLLVDPQECDMDKWQDALSKREKGFPFRIMTVGMFRKVIMDMETFDGENE